MNVMNSLWDKKSKTYSKFEGELNDFQKDFFRVLKEFGMDFKDKTMIDIGCGTGKYSLYLAQFCKEIFCVDISKGMLGELKKSAKKFNILNIKTEVSDFNSLKTDAKFDIAFLTMSPALKNEDDFDKFLNLGKERVYLNWLKPRSSSLLNHFFQKHNVKRDKNVTVFKLEKFLKDREISYKFHDFFERRDMKRDFNATLENILWHLEINGLNLSQDEVKKELKLIFKKENADKEITDRVKAHLRVLVF